MEVRILPSPLRFIAGPWLQGGAPGSYPVGRGSIPRGLTSIPGSSSGRTTDSESVNAGSNPAPGSNVTCSEVMFFDNSTGPESWKHTKVCGRDFSPEAEADIAPSPHCTVAKWKGIRLLSGLSWVRLPPVQPRAIGTLVVGYLFRNEVDTGSTPVGGSAQLR